MHAPEPKTLHSARQELKRKEEENKRLKEQLQAKMNLTQSNGNVPPGTFASIPNLRSLSEEQRRKFFDNYTLEGLDKLLAVECSKGRKTQLPGNTNLIHEEIRRRRKL